MRFRRPFWGYCFNCHDSRLRGGCLCWTCVRAALVPVVLAELVHWCFR